MAALFLRYFVKNLTIMSVYGIILRNENFGGLYENDEIQRKIS